MVTHRILGSMIAITMMRLCAWFAVAIILFTFRHLQLNMRYRCRYYASIYSNRSFAEPQGRRKKVASITSYPQDLVLRPTWYRFI
uniref:Putative secreted protein n=1 Tax=Anopheles darlingi TaxID=43151 RepID=A0A2M4D3A4_ANODA